MTIRRSKNPKYDVRQRILEAAAALFGAQGLHATRTFDIAAAAGTTERTLFKYFPTKDSLYAATLTPVLLDASIAQGIAQTQMLFAQTGLGFRAWQDQLLR